MKILVRLPNWLGDVVMSTAFIAALKQLYPDALIDVIIKKELSSITTLIPGLHKVHLFSKQEFKGLPGVYRFGKSLRGEQYDLFFSLPHSLSALVMGRVTGAKERIGFANEGGIFLLTNAYKKPVNMHRVDEYISLLEKFSGKTILNKQVKLTVEPNIPSNQNSVIINFNSEAESRRMPLDKGRKLINLLTSSFNNTSFILVGSAKESAYVDQLSTNAEHPERITNYCGKTDLVGLAKLMAGSNAVLTTDSGPAHLANSVGVPTIALFGAGNEHNTAPYNKKDLTVLRYGKLTCEPCVKNTCRLYGIPKCMELLNELQLINTVGKYIQHA
jgi:lipopolysaccharide heptosyltransferase II